MGGVDLLDMLIGLEKEIIDRCHEIPLDYAPTFLVESPNKPIWHKRLNRFMFHDNLPAVPPQ
jgi:hypothetical protein